MSNSMLDYGEKKERKEGRQREMLGVIGEGVCNLLRCLRKALLRKGYVGKDLKAGSKACTHLREECSKQSL